MEYAPSTYLGHIQDKKPRSILCIKLPLLFAPFLFGICMFCRKASKQRGQYENSLFGYISGSTTWQITNSRTNDYDVSPKVGTEPGYHQIHHPL